jgi:hypothetical protein
MPPAAEMVYFAIVANGRTAADPCGLARRTFTPSGRLDEALRPDLSWSRDAAIYEWERGEELGTELVEISQEDAGRLIERFRLKWGERR